jgi:CBS-domain-containing membrane protein
MSQMHCPSCGHDNIPGSDECEECFTSLTQEDTPAQAGRKQLEDALTESTVADLQPATPVCIPENTDLATVISQLSSGQVGCLLVTGATGKLCGIITERDFLNRVALEALDLTQARVADFMTPNPDTIEPDKPLGYALQRMMVGDLRHLPLVDEAGTAVGIISSRDVVRYLSELVDVD